MEEKRKKTGRHTPDAMTSSKRKNQSLGKTRRKKERKKLKEATK